MINVQVSDVRSGIKKSVVLVHNDDFTKSYSNLFTNESYYEKINFIKDKFNIILIVVKNMRLIP